MPYLQLCCRQYARRPGACKNYYERLSEIRDELGTDHVFDVIGEVFPSNLLEKLFREMYARRTDLPNIEARIVHEVDANRFRRITDSTLEGLAEARTEFRRPFSASRPRHASGGSSRRLSRISLSPLGQSLESIPAL